MAEAGEHAKPDVRDTGAAFGQTNWTAVIRPGAGGDAKALEELCRVYWPPLYAFLRRSGYNNHDAQDLVQGFFAHFLAKESRLRSAHPSKGRFRSYLLACLRNYVSNRRKYDIVRQPDQPLLSIDEVLGEGQYHLEPAELSDPAEVFHRRWAATVVDEALKHLQRSWAGAGEGDYFKALLPYLNGDANRGDYSSIAAQFGKDERAIRTAVSRLRKDYRNSLLREISRTVEDPSEVEDELRTLFEFFGR